MTGGRSATAYERVQQQIEIPMLVLSLAFIPIIAIPVFGNPTDVQRTALEATSWFIWAAFVCEYLVLLYLAPDRRHMVRTHLFDLAIIVLPFLRPLRALRILRAGAALGRGTVALRRISNRPGFRAFLAVAGAIIVASAGLVAYFERDAEGANVEGFADALWWALVTSTTVGYGDHFPVSPEGRAIAVVLMMLGIALFSVLTANIAAFFVETGSDDAQVSLVDLDERLARMEQLMIDARDLGLAPLRSVGGSEDSAGSAVREASGLNAPSGAAEPD